MVLAVLGAVIAIGGVVLAIRAGDGDQGASDRPPTTIADGAATTAPTDGDTTTTAEGGDEEPEPATTLVEAPTTTAGPPLWNGVPPTQPPAPPGPCTAGSGQLADRLRAHPPLADIADALTVTEIRCSGGYASAVVQTVDTSSMLAVFQRQEPGWVVLAVSDTAPCANLGIPAEAEAALNCAAW